MNIKKWLLIALCVCGGIAFPPAGILLIVSLILYNKFCK